MKFPSQNAPAKLFLQPGHGSALKNRLAGDGTFFEGSFGEAIQTLLLADDGKMGDEYCIIVPSGEHKMIFAGYEIQEACRAGIIGRG